MFDSATPLILEDNEKSVFCAKQYFIVEGTFFCLPFRFMHMIFDNIRFHVRNIRENDI